MRSPPTAREIGIVLRLPGVPPPACEVVRQARKHARRPKTCQAQGHPPKQKGPAGSRPERRADQSCSPSPPSPSVHSTALVTHASVASLSGVQGIKVITESSTHKQTFLSLSPSRLYTRALSVLARGGRGHRAAGAAAYSSDTLTTARCRRRQRAEATSSDEKSTATDSAAIFDPLLGDSTTILPRGVCVRTSAVVSRALLMLAEELSGGPTSGSLIYVATIRSPSR